MKNMKTITFKNNWLTATALLIVLPTAYLSLVGVLSALGINGPLEATQPVAEEWGIKDPPGIEHYFHHSLWTDAGFPTYHLPILKDRMAPGKRRVLSSFYISKKRWFPILIICSI